MLRGTGFPVARAPIGQGGEGFDLHRLPARRRGEGVQGHRADIRHELRRNPATAPGVDPTVTDDTAHAARPRWGYLAALWCLLFAVLHLYWALGGTLGLASSAGAELASRRPSWFVLGGLWGVAVVLLIGAGFCAGMVRWRLSGTLQRAVAVLGWLGGAVLLARGVLVELLLATDATGLATEVGAEQTRWSLFLWNPWFVLGGALVLLAANGLHRGRG